MRARVSFLLLSVALLLTPFGAAEADEVVVGVQGTATTHVPGNPTTTDPWRSLTTAGFVGDGVRDEWTGTATLGGPVPAGSKVIAVGWGLGFQHPNGCEVLIQFAEVDPHVAADNTITVSRTYKGGDELSTPFTCLDVVLSTNEGLPTDWVTGPLTPHTRTSGVEAEPAGGRFVVAAGRTTPTIVMVTSHVRATDGATVKGTGERIAVSERVTGAVLPDRARPVVVRVAAERAGRSRVELRARDDRDSSAFDASWRVVAREVEAQRPLPGRYVSADGSVHFRVTHDFRVVRFRVRSVPCEESGLDYEVRLSQRFRLPRSGATARVITIPDAQFGDAYYGVQLLTVSPRRVVGTFAVATYGCTGAERFSAQLQS